MLILRPETHGTSTLVMIVHYGQGEEPASAAAVSNDHFVELLFKPEISVSLVFHNLCCTMLCFLHLFWCLCLVSWCRFFSAVPWCATMPGGKGLTNCPGSDQRSRRVANKYKGQTHLYKSMTSQYIHPHQKHSIPSTIIQEPQRFAYSCDQKKSRNVWRWFLWIQESQASKEISTGTL